MRGLTHGVVLAAGTVLFLTLAASSAGRWVFLGALVVAALLAAVYVLTRFVVWAARH